MVDAISAPRAGHANEDALGVCGSAAWVIDGASPLGGDRTAASGSPARAFARALSHSLSNQAASISPSTTAHGLLEKATSHLPKDGGDHLSNLPPSAAGGVLKLALDGGSLTYSVIADVVIVIGIEQPLVITDPRMAAINAEGFDAVAHHLARGLTLEQARERIDDLLIRQRLEQMNREGGYWVLTANPDTAKQALNGSAEICETEPWVLVCSDGFGRLAEESQMYSWTELMRAAVDRGLYALTQELREFETNETSDRSFPRLARYDDATALLLTVG